MLELYKSISMQLTSKQTTLFLFLIKRIFLFQIDLGVTDYLFFTRKLFQRENTYTQIMLRCNIWLSSVDVIKESVASGGKLNLLSSYKSDMKLSVWQYIFHFIQIDFQCHIFQRWKSWTTYYVFLCLFIISLTSKRFVLISFSTVKFSIFIDVV